MSGGSYRSGAPALPKRNAEELADALRVRASYLGGERFEAPATAAMMHEAAAMLDELRGAALALERGDLEALVAAFAREHFSYNGQGAAALRAYHVLAEAVESDADAIAIARRVAPTNQPTTNPQRTEP